MPQPFFPPPHAILEVFVDDYSKLLESVFASIKLELLGFSIGGFAGFVIGVLLGWSRAFGYWAHPIMRFIGPLPSIAWLPIAFFAFPSSWSASIFLIALTTGFPVAVLTWSGVASVNSSYYDVARTLGASPAFLVFKVAIPAALPQVFVGLFMGLGASFAVLVMAEMMGVKAGLGFYLQWAQGLGFLFQHVCGADRDVADVFRPDHPAVQGARPRSLLSEGGSAMVRAATIAKAPAGLGGEIDIRGVSHRFDLDGGSLADGDAGDRVQRTSGFGEGGHGDRQALSPPSRRSGPRGQTPGNSRPARDRSFLVKEDR